MNIKTNNPLLGIYGDRLILITGNIASGKSTIAKELSKQTGWKYMETTATWPYLGDLIFETPGVGWKVRDIKSRYKEVLTVRLVADIDTTERRLVIRDKGMPQSGMLFYRRVKPELEKEPYDMKFYTSNSHVIDDLTAKDIVYLICEEIQQRGWVKNLESINT